ncbi:MAG: aminoglycoside phosphotransferase family protein [Chloroflexi bacterium]|nr:aminoglycoside phosphotransferase family protein [Chloroflexota bacterium]
MIITDINQATTDWLTQVLRRQGLLPQGKATKIEWGESRQTNVSLVRKFAVRYDRETTAPTRFFLKIPNPDFLWGDREVDFYKRIALEMRQQWEWDELPFLHCLDVVYDAENGRSHILFPDISDTHYAIENGAPNLAAHREQAIDAFARLHAFWWEHPRLGQGVGERMTAADIDESIAATQEKARDFIQFRGPDLSPEHRAILENVVAAWPERRLAHLLAGKGITLVHRDLHPLNALYPRDPAVHHTLLIDWQSWRVDTGTDDLAYYIACHWPDAVRQETERPLLQRYHRQLVALGVDNYAWDDCWYDYRASIIRCLFFLIAAWNPVQIQRGWWLPKVERGLSAFAQLDCREIMT